MRNLHVTRCDNQGDAWEILSDALDDFYANHCLACVVCGEPGVEDTFLCAEHLPPFMDAMEVFAVEQAEYAAVEAIEAGYGVEFWL